MATLKQLRTGLKEALQTIDGLNVYDYVEAVVETPAAVVTMRPGNQLHPTGEFVGAMGRGLDTWYFEVWIFCAIREGGYGQSELDQFIEGDGDKSIRRAIWNNSTLGLDDTDATAESVFNYNAQHSYMKIMHVGASIGVCVRTSGHS